MAKRMWIFLPKEANIQLIQYTENQYLTVSHPHVKSVEAVLN